MLVIKTLVTGDRCLQSLSDVQCGLGSDSFMWNLLTSVDHQSPNLASGVFRALQPHICWGGVQSL